MLPFLPLAIGVLGLGAYAASKRRADAQSRKAGEGGLTPERAIVYETALKSCKDAPKLRELAKTFRAEGLEPHAVMLEKRANLRDLPPASKAARREAFKKGMTSQNPQAIANLADAFDHEGATGAADHLRMYASGLAAMATASTPDVDAPPNPLAAE